MSHQSFNNEAQFEQAVVDRLVDYGWRDGILLNPTERDLLRNWADQLLLNNNSAQRLNGVPLTDTEMQQLVERISRKSPLELNAFINGETDIRRDNPDDPAHLGKTITLTLYNRDEIGGGKSKYQIARQPIFETPGMTQNRRGDLMLLINGMPVFHLELKKSGVDVSQAVNQIEKYTREQIFHKGIYSLVQIFVAMNPEETLYFANPGYKGKFNKDFQFHWADRNNEAVNEWEPVVRDLLAIPMAHQLIGYYTVADGKDGVLKVMRSYQYYAASAISNQVAQHRWGEQKIYGGYVWHTTGSGKTMTSFKSAQLIAQSRDNIKVVFLLDRIELGTQSFEEYQGFAPDDLTVQDTANTEALVRKLENPHSSMRLIVTSIQKMGLVNTDNGFSNARLDRIRQQNLVFIIDECHRAAGGQTLADIKRNFPKALYFGFTGTPKEEVNKGDGLTTRDLFGNVLHTYTIADGIRDKNVLGFDHYMVQTYPDRNVRESVALAAAKADSLEEVFADGQKTEVFNRIMSLPMVADAKNPATGKYEPGVEDMLPNEQYRTDAHREAVVEDIKDNFPLLSAGGKFHAILATSSILEAIEYYRLLKAKCPSLKCTAIFDPTIDNNGQERAAIKEEGLQEILTDYNDRFGTSFEPASWQIFKKDVSSRMSHKKPYANITRDKQLDIMIVVDQMLTGFDSKWVNTLYLDKVMEYDSLIQAFSRTNRLFGHEKRFGVIRYYRRPHLMKRNIRDAVDLYAVGRPQGLFVVKIGHNIDLMNRHFAEIKYLFEQAGIPDFASLPTDESVCARFAKEWRALNAALDCARMQGFTWEKKRYSWTDEDETPRRSEIRFTESEYNVLAQRYKDLFNGGGGGGRTSGGDVPYEIEPYLVEIDTGRIDTDYMNSRFKKFIQVLYTDTEAEALDAVREELHRSFTHLSAEEQHYANMFLTDLQQGHVRPEDVDPDKNLSDYIADYRAAAKNDQLHRFAEALGIDEQQLRDIIGMNLPADNLNQGGHYQRLAATLDKPRAKAFLEQVKGIPVMPFHVTGLADELLRRFITSGGFDINDL